MALYFLNASPETVQRGALDGNLPPVLTVKSGDTVIVECVSGSPRAMPAPELGFEVPRALQAILDMPATNMSGHILTGPVAIRGAEPGDMLEVKIEKIDLGAAWGYCAFHSGTGSLPEEFPYGHISHISIDLKRRSCALPWGPELSLSPFFGIMAVGPRLEYGRLSSKEPREFGGNLDNKELTAGSTLYLPVWVSGANFVVGDGHGVQGDGEVCVNALEMCLTGTFKFILHKGDGPNNPRLRFPRAETPTHYISMGLNADLNLAAKQAVREMIEFIGERTGWSRAEAYKSCSLAVDFRVTQNVNGEKGVHGMLQKGILF